MKLQVYEDSCCGPGVLKDVLQNLKDHYKNALEVEQISLLNSNTVSVPVDVIAALLSYGKKALPLVVMNNKVLSRGSSASFSSIVDAITAQKKSEEQDNFKPSKLMQPLVLTEMLLSPEKLDYGMVTPQCCSTTYFCACSST